MKFPDFSQTTKSKTIWAHLQSNEPTGIPPYLLSHKTDFLLSLRIPRQFPDLGIIFRTSLHNGTTTWLFMYHRNNPLSKQASMLALKWLILRQVKLESQCTAVLYTDFVNFMTVYRSKFKLKVTTHDMQTSKYKHLLVPAVGLAFVYMSSVVGLKSKFVQQVVGWIKRTV